MNRVLTVLVVVGVAAAAVSGWTQEQGAEALAGELQRQTAEAEEADQPESPGVAEKPPKEPKSWSEIVENWMTVRPVAKSRIVRIDEQYCYPHAAVSFKMEIVQEDDDTVWVRGLPPEDPESALHKMWLRRESTQRDLVAVDAYLADEANALYLLDLTQEILPPPFMDGLTFEPGPGSLPTGGLWQMNFAVDDMNEDGVADLVFPPTRKGQGRPFIFLGKGGGTFDHWGGVRWAAEVPFDYGGIATGDFDGDGHRDVVFAIHFKAQYVLYGDGKGDFSRSRRLPSPDPRVNSRAPTVADFNGDGRDDVAFLAELDVDMATNERIEDVPTLWVVLNLQGGWTLQREGLPGGVIGEKVTAVDVDGDGRTDLVIAPGTIDWRQLVYLNRGAQGWEEMEASGVLSNAYHFDVDVRGEGDARGYFATFAHFRTVDGTTRGVTGIMAYQLGEAGLEAPEGPVFYDDQRYNPVYRIGAGDLNGDGRTDLVVGRKKGGLEVFVQNPSGEFYLERSPELAEVGRAYDIELLDLDGDGADDLVASFTPVDERPGGIRVWFTRRPS
jgi:hypothetical protein